MLLIIGVHGYSSLSEGKWQGFYTYFLCFTCGDIQHGYNKYCFFWNVNKWDLCFSRQHPAPSHFFCNKSSNWSRPLLIDCKGKELHFLTESHRDPFIRKEFKTLYRLLIHPIHHCPYRFGMKCWIYDYLRIRIWNWNNVNILHIRVVLCAFCEAR